MSSQYSCTSSHERRVIFIFYHHIMKNLINFLLLIAVVVTVYVVIDDHISLRDETLEENSKTYVLSNRAFRNNKQQPSSNLQSFEANGTEPFWAADMSGTTLVWQNPDQGIITINWFTWPILSWANYVWTESVNNSAITFTPWSCTNGMSEQVFLGSISIVFGGQTRNGCASY